MRPARPTPPNLGAGGIVVGFDAIDAIDVYVYECVTDTDGCRTRPGVIRNRVSMTSCHAHLFLVSRACSLTGQPSLFLTAPDSHIMATTRTTSSAPPEAPRV